MAALSPAGPQAIHFMVEAKKIAFADRNAHAGDPAVTGFDVSAFISKDCARAAAKTIDLDKASVYAGHDPTGGDTTSFVAWDAKGNCCSFIHSNAFAFGSGVMVPGTECSSTTGQEGPSCWSPGIPIAWRPGSARCIL